jgi:hypothetical protein
MCCGFAYLSDRALGAAEPFGGYEAIDPIPDLITDTLYRNPFDRDVIENYWKRSLHYDGYSGKHTGNMYLPQNR